LLCDVKPLRAIRVVIAASEELAQDGVVSTVHGQTRIRNSGIRQAKGRGKGACSRLLDALGLDVPTCEVILEHTDETLLRIFTPVSAAIGKIT
jgi:hypothetical protein